MRSRAHYGVFDKGRNGVAVKRDGGGKNAPGGNTAKGNSRAVPSPPLAADVSMTLPSNSVNPLEHGIIPSLTLNIQGGDGLFGGGI